MNRRKTRPKKAKLLLLSSMLTLILLSSTALAGSSLDDYEKSLFGQTYTTDDISERLSRIESNVFGEAQSGELSEREARLKTIFKSLETPEPEATPSALEPSSSSSSTPNKTTTPLKDESDYPSITAIEHVVYRRTFPHEDITERLKRLELKLFERSFNYLSLSARVDQLKRKVPMASLTAIPKTYQPSQHSSPRHQTNFSGNKQELSGPMAGLHKTLDQMEQRSFGSISEGKLLTERLDALERRNFGKVFSGESIETRISRLQSFLQYSIRPQFPSSQAPPSLPNSGYPVQTQSQARFGHSAPITTTQTQVYERRTPFGTSTTTHNSRQSVYSSAPGTVYTESYSYPGYDPRYNRQGMNGVQQQPRRYSTRYPQTTSPYGYTRTRTYYLNPNSSSQGNSLSPDMIQQLESLEMSHFGQVNQRDPLLTRLTRLELKITGRVNSSSPTERLNNLLYKSQHPTSRI